MQYNTISKPNLADKGKSPLWKSLCAYLIAPTAVGALLLLLFAVYGLFPCGGNIVAWGDMTQQSLPLLLDFKNILSGEFDLFLNTANSGGMDFWGVFLFFLSSPFSFLVTFVDAGDIYLLGNVLILLKLIACGFTANLFFKRQFPKLTIAQHTALAVMYAFCGYGMMYYQNLVWLDMMYVFPLLLMGLCRLIQKGKIDLYVVTLTAVVAINYYLSYMVILFLILSMAVYVLFAGKQSNRKKTIALFAAGSFIAALLTAVFWLPSFFQYTHSARTTDIVTSLASSTLITSIPTTFPVILCTASTLAAIPFFFLSRLYQSREGRGLLLSYCLLMIPVVLEPINKMWHTGSYQAFPVRYGYITVLLGLILTAMFLTRTNDVQRLSHPKVRTMPSVVAIIAFHLLALGAVATLLLVFKLDIVSKYVGRLWSDYEGFFYFLMFSGLAVLVYFMLYLLYHNRMVGRRVFTAALCCVVACEGFFSGSVYLGAASRDPWAYGYVTELDHKVSDGLFRTKLEKKYFDVNLVGAMGYNTLSHYTSLTDESFLFAMKKLGYSCYWMESGSNGGTLLTDMLLANRYVLAKNFDLPMEEDNVVTRGLLYSVQENPAVNSFGETFRWKGDIAALEDLPTVSRMELQQTLSDLFYDCGTVTTAYTPKSRTNLRQKSKNGQTVLTRFSETKDGTMNYRIDVTGTESLYFDCFDKTTTALKEDINDSFDVTVNGVKVEVNYPTQKNNGLLYLGTFTDERVQVTVSVHKNVTARSFGLFGVKDKKLIAANQKKTSTNLSRSGNTISGTATAETGDEYLFLPITWDSGYTATVNGKPAEVYKVLDAFMAIKLEKGENTLSLTYVPKGFKAGVAISLCGVGVFALALWALRQKWVQKLRCLELPIMILFLGIAALVFLAVYVVPLIFVGLPLLF